MTLANSLFSVEDKGIQVIENPHGNQQEACAFHRLDGLLEPYHLLTKPLPTQQDTFRELVFRKVFSVQVPIYRMKQPERLSASQFQFQLVLVRDLAARGMDLIHETPVDSNQAVDSWFAGYYWTPIVMDCDEESHHVGWKFTALQDSSTLPHFYALMVNIVEEEGTLNGVFVGGLKTAGWMANKIVAS